VSCVCVFGGYLFFFVCFFGKLVCCWVFWCFLFGFFCKFFLKLFLFFFFFFFRAQKGELGGMGTWGGGSLI